MWLYIKLLQWDRGRTNGLGNGALKQVCILSHAPPPPKGTSPHNVQNKHHFTTTNDSYAPESTSQTREMTASPREVREADLTCQRTAVSWPTSLDLRPE